MPKSTLEDHDIDQVSDDEDTSPSKQYAFPELDAQIRAVINEYGAVFPKLNFSSPKARLGQAIIPPSFIEWKKELLERMTRPGSCRRHPH